MPHTRVIFYREEDGTVPLLDWLETIPLKAQLKCLVRIERLQQMGHELRRPEADLLRDKIHELRSSHQGVHYRVLYFFHGNVAAILSHGLQKEGKVPQVEIERAKERRDLFLKNPKAHTHEE